MRKHNAVLLALVIVFVVLVLLNLEVRGVLPPVLLRMLFPVVELSRLGEAVKGYEAVIAVSLLLVLFIIFIVQAQPWLPTAYLWVDWNKWQRVGRVRPGYFSFKLLGREFKGINCGRKKIVFLEGDPEDYEVNVSDRTETITRFFERSLEQRVLGTFFKPKYKAYIARVIDDPEEIVNIGWGGEKQFEVNDEGEIWERSNPLDERLPGSVLTKREALIGIVSKMKNVIWVVPRWKKTDLRKLAEGEMSYIDVMVDAERERRNLVNMSHYIIKALRTRIGRSILVSLLSHLDATKQSYEEVDAAFTILAYLFNVDVGEIKKALSAANIRIGENPEEVLEQWLNREERRRALMERYRKLISTAPKRGKRKESLAEKIRKLMPSKGEKEESKEEEE